MFTGIVVAVGKITESRPLSTENNAGLRLSIDAGSLDMSDVILGDSIAVNGACMTVVEITPTGFKIDVSRESTSRTHGLTAQGEVNLEKSLRLADRLGGHLVSGHVDGTGIVQRFDPTGESYTLVIDAPIALAKFLTYKGSIVINGVSLTINQVVDLSEICRISINLIPHTLEVTTLKHLKIGMHVNLEVDLIARYVERMLNFELNYQPK